MTALVDCQWLSSVVREDYTITKETTDLNAEVRSEVLELSLAFRYI